MPDGPPKGYTAIESRTFRRGKEILYGHQRSSLGQPCTIPHKAAEQRLCGGCPHNNKLDILMTLHSSTRVPVDDSYAALVGKAVYVFAYYEWTIIYVIDYLRSGFVSKYSRGGSMTSGNVRQELQDTINSHEYHSTTVSKAELQACCDEFKKLIVKRNALIHAHPITDSDGSQILAYQTKVTKPLPDMKWPKAEVESIIQEFDVAACRAGALLDRLR